MALKLTVGTVTDRGLNPKRQANEDRLLSLPNARLFLVADGVGGRRGGQVASQTVADVFRNAFEDGQRAGNDLLTALKQTLTICNRSIYESSSEMAELRGMATTMAMVAAVNDTRAIIGHVGDSRVYRFDGKDLIGETQDHSEVSDAIRAGLLTPAQAATHPRRNVINRAVGAEQEVEADFKIVSLNDKTSFLLCSDGVTRHLSDTELADLFRSGAHPQRLCERIKEVCFERGAEDNLTAIIVDFGERRYTELPTSPAAAPAAAPERPTTDRAASASKAPAAAGKGQAVSANGKTGSKPAARPGRIEVEVPAPEPPRSADARSTTGRLTMLEMPEPDSRTPSMTSLSSMPSLPSLGPTPSQGPPSGSVPSMFLPDRRGGSRDSLPPTSGKEEKASASSISFWDKKPNAGSAEPVAMSESASASPNAVRANRGLTWRDYVVVFFYLALLAAAFGLGRYYDVVVAWVWDEPAPAAERTSPGKPASVDPNLLAAKALFQAGRFEAARAQLEELSTKAPNNAQYQYWLGASLQELGKHPEAIKALNEAARLDPKLTEVQVRLALAYAAVKDQKNMDDALRKAAAAAQ